MTLIIIMIPVVGFDIMEQWMDWEYVDGLVPDGLFDFETHRNIESLVFPQIVDLSYETLSSLMNLNTLGIVLFFYFFRVAIWLLLAPLAKIFSLKKLEKVTKNLQN